MDTIPMIQPTFLVATWGDGIFAITGHQQTQELARLSVPSLAPDGHGGALAIIEGHSLRRRLAGGQWATLATSDFDLSCCMAVRDEIYVGTDDARMLRLGGGGALEPLDGFDRVPGRETWFAGSAIVDGQRRGPPWRLRGLQRLEPAWRRYPWLRTAPQTLGT
ncbi:MAG: hypothetical protein K2X03_22350 [Bryobacteraceae bacterium]|nr:hypothetical protein [Bryobacteraceae bacterium]